MQRELADQHGTGGAQARNHGRVRRRAMVPPQFRMAGGGKPGDVDDVLDRIGNAVQRPAPRSARDFGLRRLRFGQRALRRDQQEGVDRRIDVVDPLEQRLGQLDRRQFARGDAARCFGERHVGEVGHAGLLPSRGTQATKQSKRDAGILDCFAFGSH
jgi:hypothetical protein